MVISTVNGDNDRLQNGKLRHRNSTSSQLFFIKNLYLQAYILSLQ